MNKGMKVVITFNENFHAGKVKETLNNVTEIHYAYPSTASGIHVAFESDIHKTGCTRDMEDIAEFEAIRQNKKAKYF